MAYLSGVYYLLSTHEAA